jgi:hypothetical protein
MEKRSKRQKADNMKRKITAQVVQKERIEAPGIGSFSPSC